METKNRGQNSLTIKWENRLGVSRTDPNFGCLVEDVLANEPEETRNATLEILGLRRICPKPIKLGPDEIPDWILREK